MTETKIGYVEIDHDYDDNNNLRYVHIITNDLNNAKRRYKRTIFMIDDGVAKINPGLIPLEERSLNKYHRELDADDMEMILQYISTTIMKRGWIDDTRWAHENIV